MPYFRFPACFPEEIGIFHLPRPLFLLKRSLPTIYVNNHITDLSEADEVPTLWPPGAGPVRPYGRLGTGPT